jgi:rod shape determining protein RodA
VSGFIAALPTGLVLVQPDFGSAAVLFCIWFGMILMSGISKKYVIALAIIVISVVSMFWLFVFKDYQKDRIMTFLAPTADIRGAGYNVHQALIAIGSGQVFGRGFGYGSQSHLKFLPENQTDFIFAVIAEEMGLLGVLIVLASWGLFFQRLLTLMRELREDFALYCVLGISLLFLVHVFFNIGGAIGIIPLTGLVLPFLSYGGSALIMGFIAVGFVQSIKVHNV